ncbi:lysozyme [Pasteurella multocida]|uniref:lysozyme n=1 Tax=Pasteurella multocida TaxID=747 RepID=UPI000353CF99|nr:lysozyme [Pasteurella multocida]AUK49150.1 glycoside hydrolase [Pasteurella multocida]AUK53759.1 glycoside hydrolase [Pasteurella multocida]EPE64041.1 lysozyme [Pasteurella multocida P1933]ESQ73131.1 lysozyme [Pasteurella multocida subsp. multocida P1062]MCL7838761.1 lysozyme [Pasteurella multocida]
MKHAKKITACSVAMIIAVVMSDHSTEIRTSERGLEIIGNAEGCAREPYRCPADVLTVGIGSTELSGLPIERKRYSDEEIAKRWVNDIKVAEKCVNNWANGKNLPQGAFEATVSITFNVGCSKLKYSTLFKHAKNGDIQAMCDQFPRWKYANGKVLRGLEIRRQKERELCLADLHKS